MVKKAIRVIKSGTSKKTATPKKKPAKGKK